MRMNHIRAKWMYHVSRVVTAGERKWSMRRGPVEVVIAGAGSGGFW